MTNSIVAIHGGNKGIIQELYNTFEGQKFGCVVNPFPNCNNLLDNIRYLAQNSVICNLTTADVLTDDEMFELRNSSKIIKFLADYEVDCVDTEKVWKGNLTREGHVRSCMDYLAFAHEVIDFRTKNIELINPPIVFSPGRCGTHALLSLLRDSYPEISHMHHNSIDSSEIERLIKSRHVFMILRRNIRDFIASMLIMNRYGAMISKISTLENDTKIVSSWKPIIVTKDQIYQCIRLLINWLHFAIYVSLTNSNNSMVYYEDLEINSTDHFVKNPYDKNKLIANLNEFDQWILEFDRYDRFIKEVVAKKWDLI